MVIMMVLRDYRLVFKLFIRILGMVTKIVYIGVIVKVLVKLRENV